MPPVSARERLRYEFDNFMARGTGALVLALFLVTSLVVVVVSTVAWAAGWVDGDVGLVGTLWRSMLATFDPAIVGGEHGSPLFLLALLGVTFAGIFVTSILIGILTTGLEGRLAELRKGRSRVVDQGHTVILGWSQQIYTILSELVAAGANRRRSAVVVLADRGKVEMEDEIRARVGATGRTRIVCRSGDPIDAGDLHIASVDTARSVVVLSPPGRDADANVIKTILAITSSPGRRREPYHIVAELRDAANLAAAEIAGRGEAELVVVGDLVARITAQTCRQSGLSAVYEALLDFEGDEMYVVDAPARLVGRPFAEALLAFETSGVMGVRPRGAEVLLNPPMDRPIAEGDGLLVIAEDDGTTRVAARPPGIREDAIVRTPASRREPERTLLVDWNRRAGAVIRELDRYVVAGSRCVVLTDRREVEAELEALRPELVNQGLEIRHGTTTDARRLAEVCREGHDHVIVLSTEDADPQVADARTLMTLLHLREIESRDGHDFSITSEMIDLRNRALAQVTRADDFIVSDRIASLLLGQLSENEHLKAVFDDLFDSDGSEIYLRPAGEYVTTGLPLSFATVVASASLRGETAIGYRRMADADDPDRAYGVTLNPGRDAELVFDPADRVIVLAAQDGEAPLR